MAYHKIILLCPTRNRHEKLIRMMESVHTKHDLSFVIVEDGSETTSKLLNGKRAKTLVLTTGDHVGSVQARNMGIRHCLAFEEFDIMIIATDDIVFDENAIDRAIASLEHMFPNRVGMVGFRIRVNNNTSNSGVVAVWRELLEVFPEGQVYYPQYRHFAAQELKTVMRRLGIMHEDADALITHYHPRRYKEERDKTHFEAREHKHSDLALWKQRKNLECLWQQDAVAKALQEAFKEKQ